MKFVTPAIASIPSVGDVQKAPVIQRAALHCIFLSSLIFLTIGAPLKNQRLNLYIAIGRMQVLYRSRFCMGSKPCEKLPSIFMALRMERHFNRNDVRQQNMQKRNYVSKYLNIRTVKSSKTSMMRFALQTMN